MIGEIQIAVLAAVANVHKAAVPVRAQRKLNVEADAARNRALNIAIRRHRGGRRFDHGVDDRYIRVLDQCRTGCLLVCRSALSKKKDQR